MTILLRRAEIENLMDLRQAMAVLERTYHSQAEGQVCAVPTLRLMNRGIRLVAVGLPDEDRVGLRFVVLRKSQGGYSDVALAAWAYEQALVKGLGRDIADS